MHRGQRRGVAEKKGVWGSIRRDTPIAGREAAGWLRGLVKREAGHCKERSRPVVPAGRENRNQRSILCGTWPGESILRAALRTRAWAAPSPYLTRPPRLAVFRRTPRNDHRLRSATLRFTARLCRHAAPAIVGFPSPLPPPPLSRSASPVQTPRSPPSPCSTGSVLPPLDNINAPPWDRVHAYHSRCY